MASHGCFTRTTSGNGGPSFDTPKADMPAVPQSNSEVPQLSSKKSWQQLKRELPTCDEWMKRTYGC